MALGEASSFLYSKSHCVLFDSHIYITCLAPVGIDLAKARRNHRGKLRRNLFRLSRENTEQNRCLFTILAKPNH